MHFGNHKLFAVSGIQVGFDLFHASTTLFIFLLVAKDGFGVFSQARFPSIGISSRLLLGLGVVISFDRFSNMLMEQDYEYVGGKRRLERAGFSVEASKLPDVRNLIVCRVRLVTVLI